MNCLIRIRQRYPDLAQSDKKLRIIFLLSRILRVISVRSSWPRSGRQPVQRGEIRAKDGF